MVISCPGCMVFYRLEASLLEGCRAVRFRCRSCGDAFLVKNPKASRRDADAGPLPSPADVRETLDPGHALPERADPIVLRQPGGLAGAGVAAPAAAHTMPGPLPEEEPETAPSRDVAAPPESPVPADPPREESFAPADQSPPQPAPVPRRIPLNVVPFPVRGKADLSERIRPVPVPKGREEPPGDEPPESVSAPTPAAEGDGGGTGPAAPPGTGESGRLPQAAGSPPEDSAKPPGRPEERKRRPRPAGKGGTFTRTLQAGVAALVLGAALLLLAPPVWNAPLKTYLGIRELPVRYEVVPRFAGYRETPLAGTVYLFEGAIRVREGTLRTGRLRIWISFLDSSDEVVAERPFLVAEQTRAGVQLEGSREKVEEALSRAAGVHPDRTALAGEDVPVTALLLDPPKGIASFRVKSYYEGDS